MRVSNIHSMLILMLLVVLVLPTAWAETPVQVESESEQSKLEQNDSSVMQAFSSREVVKSDIVAIEDETKRLVMFFLGVPLLLLLIATVALGIAMVIYGKQVFVAHMVCAGLSLTLAMAHAIVGIVWFYPF